eukprot:m.754275 g.754275  ORF g.754275 m.754275 type:complete len:238 (-) comp23175_c0_seq24:2613-3326(-)
MYFTRTSPGTILFFVVTLSVVANLATASTSRQENPYDVLGVPADATNKDIKRAFRKLALEYHPDRNKEKDAESKFIRIAAAYELLMDDDLRREYDNAAKQDGDNSEDTGPGGPDNGFSFQDYAANYRFDYDEFFKDFDSQIQSHMNSHLNLLRKNGLSTEHVDQIAQTLHQHQALHMQSVRKAMQMHAKHHATAALLHQGPPAHYGKTQSSTVDMTALFEDTDESDLELFRKYRIPS